LKIAHRMRLLPRGRFGKAVYRFSVFLLFAALLSGLSYLCLEARTAGKEAAGAAEERRPQPSGRPTAVSSSPQNNITGRTVVDIGPLVPSDPHRPDVQQTGEKPMVGENGAWVACDLAGGVRYGENCGSALKVASLAKLFAVVAAERLIPDWEQTWVTYREEDYIGGTGSLQYWIAPGDSLTVRGLVRLMLEESDNIAYRMLLRHMGRDKVEEVLKDAGLNVASGRGNLTTVEDVAGALLLLLRGTHRNEVVGWMVASVYKDGIPRGLPEGVFVANKEGYIGNSVVADAAVVFAPRPYILVAVVNDEADGEGYQKVREISSYVYKLMNSESFIVPHHESPAAGQEEAEGSGTV